MKKISSFSVICILQFVICNLQPIISFAQSPQYSWVKGIGGTFHEEGMNCTSDINGNTIVTGFFQSDTIKFGTIPLINSGSSITADMFIVKYDTSGNVLWAKSVGGTSDDVGVNCSTDASGNIIVTGLFQSSTITFGTTTLNNAGNKDMFIVKYDANGNVLWAKSAGGNLDDRGCSCATDANGNIFITGFFYSASISLGITTLTNAGSNSGDMYIVKFDPSGNILWAKSTGGTSDDSGLSCFTDANSNVLVTGYFYSPTITFGSTTLTCAGVSDMFIVKYNPSGNVVWAKSAGGTSYEQGNSCSTDANGNIIITGYFASPTVTFGTTTLTSAGSYDMFIVKYNTSGNVLWAKSAGGNSADYGNSCFADASGNIIITGCFASSSVTFGNTTLANAGNYDIFIVKYNASGNIVWAKRAGGNSSDQGLGCSVDVYGNVLVTGYFSSAAITFGTTTLTDAGGYDIFIVKLDSNSSVAGIPPITNLNTPVNLFPNPTSNDFFIDANTSDKLNVDLYDVNGRQVFSANVNDKSTINVTTLDEGIYTMTIKTVDQIINKKVVILR
jgi:hypothetical protein